MSNHFVAINRGVPGVALTDFTVGASSSASSDIELRVADAASVTDLDIKIALEAFIRFYLNRNYQTFPPL